MHSEPKFQIDDIVEFKNYNDFYDRGIGEKTISRITAIHFRTINGKYHYEIAGCSTVNLNEEMLTLVKSSKEQRLKIRG